MCECYRPSLGTPHLNKQTRTRQKLLGGKAVEFRNGEVSKSKQEEHSYLRSVLPARFKNSHRGFIALGSIGLSVDYSFIVQDELNCSRGNQ
jgi:hypothetical protein